MNSTTQELGRDDELSPLRLFSFAYAILHCPSYRERYFEFLRSDFPRLPLTGNLELFRELAQLGGELVALHLLESPRLDQPITEFIGGRNPEVEKISWSHDTVWIDRAKTIGFHGVSDNVWNFHIGGYQVCEKWLKDRKGRMLSDDDIAHYHKIVVALSETIRLMGEIDEVIAAHGGWPGAFAAASHAQESPAESVADEPEAASERVRAPARAPAPSRARKSEAIPDLFAALPVAANEPPVAVGRIADIDAFDRNELCARIRQTFAEGPARVRDTAIVELARSLGYQRTGKNIREALDNALRTAVRRGILANDGDGLRLRYRSIEQFEADDRDGLKDQFLAALEGRTWIERSEATHALARWLGFTRTGAKIEEIAASLVNGLLREGRLEADGSRIRRAG